MEKLTLEEVLEVVKALSPAEQKKVREMLESDSIHSREKEVARRLLARGVIGRLPDRQDTVEYRRYTPVKVQGKPLSETIVEERR